MRLIDADALLHDARRLIDYAEDDGVEHCFRINAVEVAAINAAPTIDAEPVRHGEWVHVEDDEYLCSACKMEFTIEDFDSFVTNYCPNCGAKMDGGKNETESAK